MFTTTNNCTPTDVDRWDELFAAPSNGMSEALKAGYDAINASIKGFPPVTYQEITEIADAMLKALENSAALSQGPEGTDRKEGI